MPWTISKRMEVAGAHKLALPYESKCANLHGHNWIIEVQIIAAVLNPEGMVMDFSKIKRIVNTLDHHTLNDIIPQPTAENLCQYIHNKIKEETLAGQYAKVMVKVKESEDNESCYTE